MRLLSGYLESPSGVTLTANAINQYGLDGTRASFSFSASHSWNPALVTDFLNKAPGKVIIVDAMHYYPPTSSADWQGVRNRAFDILTRWPNNPLVYVELINEYKPSDLPQHVQPILNEIKEAGYTNKIGVMKWYQNSSGTEGNTWTQIANIQNLDFSGLHPYFDYQSPAGANSQEDQAASHNLNIINTEVGASTSDTGINQSLVNETNQFLAYSEGLGHSNCLWMNTVIKNLARYVQYGLSWFANVEPPPEPEPIPEPTPTPNPSVAARVPMIGNSALIQYYMRKLRDKIISEEVHEKIHPLV